MLKIGITGGIGSGKTTVCRIFEVLDIPVFYADAVAKSIMSTDEVLISGVKDAFGPESYSASGELNRKYIAGIVFNDPRKLEKLNGLVHPAVFRAFDKWVKEKEQFPYVVKEAALLFESGSYKLCDHSVLVISPPELRMKRVMHRDSVSEENVQLRMNRQLSDDQKRAMADFFIANNEQQLLIPQVLRLHKMFLEMKSLND